MGFDGGKVQELYDCTLDLLVGTKGVLTIGRLTKSAGRRRMSLRKEQRVQSHLTA
jgi:hypothetical protein